MKTAKEIINNLAEAIQANHPEQHRLCFVVALTDLEEQEKQIQLDAYKAGMTEAAEIATNHKIMPGQKDYKVWKESTDSVAVAIITARDNKLLNGDASSGKKVD